MFVLFEGIDGVGKSTQIEILSKILPNSLKTYEPGATDFGKKIREILLNGDYDLSKNAEMFLFLADRAEHHAKIISQNTDKILLCDRGFISGMAYAMSNDENLDANEILKFNKFAMNGVLPDKIVLFVADESLVSERIKWRGTADTIEKRGMKYLLKVQENMQKIVKILGIKNIIINADDKIENITENLINFIKEN